MERAVWAWAGVRRKPDGDVKAVNSTGAVHIRAASDKAPASGPVIRMRPASACARPIPARACWRGVDVRNGFALAWRGLKGHPLGGFERARRLVTQAYLAGTHDSQNYGNCGPAPKPKGGLPPAVVSRLRRSLVTEPRLSANFSIITRTGRGDVRRSASGCGEVFAADPGEVYQDRTLRKFAPSR